MINPTQKIYQSDAMSVLAELETSYRAMRSASADVADGKAGYGYDPPIQPRLHTAMDVIQEIQRNIMEHMAVELDLIDQDNNKENDNDEKVQ